MPILLKKQTKKQQAVHKAVQAFRARARDCTYGPPESLSRRRRLENDTATWLKYYLAEAFPSPFAPIHREYIGDLDYITTNGGWKAVALPRGSGKTTIAMGYALKCILTGLSQYAVIISAKATLSRENISKLKSWLLHNDRLAADYPEVCVPIRHTKGIPQSMATLTAFGEPVNVKWKAAQVVLPDAPMISKDGKKTRAVSANAIIECEGITGAIRGMAYTRPDGANIRPDLAIPDDPQTPESARSAEQTRQRLDIIFSDVAGLSGPSKDIRIIVPCTIMQEGCLADQITDPEMEPDFLGQRYPFFISMPGNMTLWEQYNAVRTEGLKRRDRGRAARAFFKLHQAALEAGAVVSWPDRKGDTAVNGIQWGMNEYFRRGPVAFAKELQNQPMPSEEMIRISKEIVIRCEVDRPKWQVREDSVCNVAFIDLNPRTSGLHWAIVSYGEKLSGHIPAYGRHPSRGVLVPEGASETQEDALVFEGLRVLCKALGEAPLKNGSNPAKIDLVMIDGGYNFSTVVSFCKSARMPFPTIASRGRAASKYLDAGRDVVKAMKHIHMRKNAKGERYLSHNACALCETVHRAFVAGPDAPGGISIHKRPPVHDEFAEQITAKRLTDKAEGLHGPMYRWSLLPGGQDHWLDCVVGACAGAHWLGMEAAGTRQVRNVKRQRIQGSAL